MTPVLQVVHRDITRFLLNQAGLKAEQADSGAATLIQRFASAANLNIHLHCLVLDGVYRCDAEGEAVFVEVPAPTDEALETVLPEIITRMMKLRTRKGCSSKSRAKPTWPTTPRIRQEARVLRPLQAAAWPCRPRRTSGPTPRQAQSVHWTV